MKHSHSIMYLLVAGALFLFTASALCQEQPSGAGQEQQPGRRGMMMQSPQERLDSMAKELNLTDDQKAKIKPILEDERDKMQALRQDTSMSREDRMAKMMDIRKNSSDEIKKVLDKDQQKKYDEMMRSRMGPGGRGGRPQAPPPPSQ